MEVGQKADGGRRQKDAAAGWRIPPFRGFTISSWASARNEQRRGPRSSDRSLWTGCSVEARSVESGFESPPLTSSSWWTSSRLLRVMVDGRREPRRRNLL